jgi:hypothetical protein
MNQHKNIREFIKNVAFFLKGAAKICNYKESGPRNRIS